MIKKILFMLSSILILGIAYSCQNKLKDHNLVEEEGAIISLFIDKMAVAYPVPPPPPMDSLEMVIQQTNWDSISRIKTDIIVDTVMFTINRKSDLPLKYKAFQFLVESIIKLPKKSIHKNFLQSKEGHHLIFGNSLDDYTGKYPQMVGISRIAFNEEKDMAAVYAGYSTHSLAAYLNLYLLKKMDGEWKIVYEKNISVS